MQSMGKETATNSLAYEKDETPRFEFSFAGHAFSFFSNQDTTRIQVRLALPGSGRGRFLNEKVY